MKRKKLESLVSVRIAQAVLPLLGAGLVAGGLSVQPLTAGPAKVTTGESSAKPPETTSVPEEIRERLDAAVQEKIKLLLDEKNEDSVSFRRGVNSKTYMKVDDQTYKVSFHIDTAEKERLKTERLLLTLENDPAAQKWKVDSEEVQDTYIGLVRSIPGDEKFQLFDEFVFEREGFKVSGGKGSLYEDFVSGKARSIRLEAADLKYELTPPIPRDAFLWEKLKKDNAGDVVFVPERVTIECDTETCAEFLAKCFKGLSEAKLAGVGGKLRDKYEDFQKELKKARRENAFSGFRRPPEPDNKYYSITVIKDNPDRYLGLQYDNYDPKEVAVWAYNLDKAFPDYQPLYRWYSEATLESGVSPYDLEMRDDQDTRDYDLTGVTGTVDMALHDSEELVADLTYKLTTKRELREVPFRISRLRQTQEEKKETKDPQLIIESIQDGEGHELTWVKGGPSSGLVVLPERAPAGTPITIRMKFTNKAGIYKINPTFSYVSRFGWLPFVRFTDPVQEYDLTVKVPAQYKTLGIGKKVSDTVEKGVNVSRWVAESMVEFPSIIFGQYEAVQSKVKATKQDGTEIPVWVHVDKSAFGDWGITPKSLQVVADQAANSLNIYREVFGVDYPYGKLDVVNDPLGSFYGQSPSSLIYLGSAVFWGEGKAGVVGRSNNLSRFNRLHVVPHEVGHQWWGSLIPNHNDGNYWFVESLAEYSSAIFAEAFEAAQENDPKAGWKSYMEQVDTWKRTVLETDLQSSVQDASVQWSGHLYNGYRAAVYNKGPYAFHTMRMTWGDEKFFKFMKRLAQTLKSRPIVTLDIQRVAEEAFGGNMDFFFDQWLRGVGQPEYTFTYKVRQTEDGKWMVEGSIDQRVLVGTKKDLLDGTYFTAVVPVSVTVRNGKEQRFPFKISGRTTPFRFKVEQEPKDIILNKYGESLAYDVITKRES